MNGFGVSPEIAASLARGNGGAQVIVMMLMQIESLGVRISNQVVEVLRLPEAVLRTRGRVMMGRKGGWKIRRLKVRCGGKRCTPVMGHSTAVTVSSVSMVMSARVRRRIPTAQ